MNLLLSDPAFLSVAAGIGAGYDTDAANYIAAVEAADAAAGSPGGLETAVKDAYNAFFVGCKQDGTWGAIKASCILAGARTLDGALVPLIGPAPTKYNFVAGDYNRKTGLVGNGANKWMDTNRSATADPLLNCHASSFVSSGTVGLASVAAQVNGSVVLVHRNPVAGRMRNDLYNTSSINGTVPSFVGFSRSSSTGYTARSNNVSQFLGALASNNPAIGNFATHRYLGTIYYDSRLAFYSIGESLDLALMEARVTALVNALAAAIP